MHPLYESLHRNKKILIMILIGLITAVEFLESQMFVFSASHIMGGIDAGPYEFAQVQTAYAVGIMLMVVMQNWFARHIGYRHYLMGSLGLFIIGAFASAMSDGLLSLVFARFIQGVGGGALFTSSRILVNLMFPQAERRRALKYFMLLIFSSSAIAPILAATLIDTGTWQWVFYGAIPPAVAALFGVWVLLPANLGRSNFTSHRIAMGPLLLFAIAVLCLQLMFSTTRFDIFNHPLRLIGLFSLGGLLLFGFLWQQWRHPEPLLHIRELNSPIYLVGLGLYFLYYFVSGIGGYLFPIYAEQGLGLTLIKTGWLNAIAGLSSLIMAFFYVTYLSVRFKRKKNLMITGALALAVAGWWFSRVGMGADTAQLWLGLIAKGVFGVLLVLPVAGLTFQTFDDEQFAHGYQGKNLLRQIATSASSAFAAVMLQNRQNQVDGHLRESFNPGNTSFDNWINAMQALFESHGLPAEQAHSAALAALARHVSQQAQLIACENMYQLLACMAVGVATVVAVQRKLK